MEGMAPRWGRSFQGQEAREWAHAPHVSPRASAGRPPKERAAHQAPESLGGRTLTPPVCGGMRPAEGAPVVRMAGLPR